MAYESTFWSQSRRKVKFFKASKPICSCSLFMRQRIDNKELSSLRGINSKSIENFQRIPPRSQDPTILFHFYKLRKKHINFFLYNFFIQNFEIFFQILKSMILMWVPNKWTHMFRFPYHSVSNKFQYQKTKNNTKRKWKKKTEKPKTKMKTKIKMD